MEKDPMMYDQLGWPSLLRLFLGSLLSTAAKQAYTETCRRLRFDVVKLVCNGYLLCCFNRIIIYMQNIPQNASPFPFLHFSQCICIDQIATGVWVCGTLLICKWMDISGTDKTCHVPGQKPRAKVLGKPAKPFGGKSVVGRGEPGVGSYGLIGGGGGEWWFGGWYTGSQPKDMCCAKSQNHHPLPLEALTGSLWSSTFRCPTKTKLKSLGFKIS